MAHASQSFRQKKLLGNRRHGPKSAAQMFPHVPGVYKSLQQFIVAQQLFRFFVRFHMEKGNIKFVFTSSLGHLSTICGLPCTEGTRLLCGPPWLPSLISETTFYLLYGFISWLSLRQLSPERFLLFQFLLGLFVMQNLISFQLLLTCCWS